MRVLVVGSGAREHALALACGRSADVLVAPGNPGMAGRTPAGHSIVTAAIDPASTDADLVVVGPEAPLVAGLADRLRARGIPVLGPGAAGARLEGSKAFMKGVAAAANVPTARFRAVQRVEDAAEFFAGVASGPFVVKTDGLAGGKGVLVAERVEEALSDVAAKLSGAAFGAAGTTVVVEEALRGPELSLLVLCDGTRAVALPCAQDFKRVGDDDAGPNTGGMGAYAPVPLASADLVGRAMDEIIHPTLAELTRRGIVYQGVLYAGLILEPDGPKLVEYNVRFGDPEAEVVLPLLGGDVTALLHATATGRLEAVDEPVVAGAAVGVVCAAPGYPGEARTGERISGLEKAATVEGVTVLHGATAADGDGFVTAGGRVLTIVGTATDLDSARARAYAGVAAVDFPGMHYRHDIAARPSRAQP